VPPQSVRKPHFPTLLCLTRPTGPASPTRPITMTAPPRSAQGTVKVGEIPHPLSQREKIIQPGVAPIPRGATPGHGPLSTPTRNGLNPLSSHDSARKSASSIRFWPDRQKPRPNHSPFSSNSTPQCAQNLILYSRPFRDVIHLLHPIHLPQLPQRGRRNHVPVSNSLSPHSGQNEPRCRFSRS
jgi:hypothetical protein